MTTEEKAKCIIRDIRGEKSTDPGRIFRSMAEKEYISMHGPEHHVLDGACILTAYANAGGKIDLEEGLQQLLEEGLKMPGAMCGLWGVCGAVASAGAALAVIDGTGPLSEDGSWGRHMAFTAAATAELGRVNGPRCCKRDARLSLRACVDHINKHYPVKLEYSEEACTFSSENRQCIRERCPYYPPDQVQEVQL